MQSKPITIEKSQFIDYDPTRYVFWDVIGSWKCAICRCFEEDAEMMPRHNNDICENCMDTMRETGVDNEL